MFETYDIDDKSETSDQWERGDYRRLQDDIHVLKGRVSVLEQKMDTFSKEVGVDLSGPGGGVKGVTFMTYLDANVAVSSLQTIIFEDTKLNIGHGYDPTTGIFTAPISGRYLFSLTVRAQYKKQACAEIVAGHIVIGQAAAGDSEIERATSSLTVMAVLTKNSEVYVRESKTFTGHYYGNGCTTFAGVLLAYVT